MDRNITPMGSDGQISFKETLILNLQRNKEILRQNIRVFEHNIVLCDELVDILENDNDAALFAEKMQALQASGAPQNR